MTREEIERLADQLIEPYGENISRRTLAADALLFLLADCDRLERERNEARQDFRAHIKDQPRLAEARNAALNNLATKLDSALARVAELEEAVRKLLEVDPDSPENQA